MCHDLVNIIAILHASLLRVTDLKQISKFRRQYMSTVSGTWVRSSHCVNSCEYFLWIPPQPIPSLLPVLYQDLWCMHALGLVWGEGRKGERDERGIGRGVKGRGVSWLFVLHCSHPCDQSREETFRALLQERHVVGFLKGSTTSKSTFVLRL